MARITRLLEWVPEFAETFEAMGKANNAKEARKKAGILEEPWRKDDQNPMHIKDLLAVVVLVALLVTLWKPEQDDVSVETETTVARESALATRPWTLDGATIEHSVPELIEMFGTPSQDKDEGGVRFTVFDTPWGSLKRTKYHEEGTVGLIGHKLSNKDGEVLSVGDTESQVKRRLGEPLFVRQGDEMWVSYQYDGTRLYLTDGSVTGIVIEGLPAKGSDALGDESPEAGPDRARPGHRS